MGEIGLWIVTGGLGPFSVRNREVKVWMLESAVRPWCNDEVDDDDDNGDELCDWMDVAWKWGVISDRFLKLNS
jgi:hypothetical protein